MVSNSAGTKLYLGSRSGLITVDTVADTASSSTGVPGDRAGHLPGWPIPADIEHRGGRRLSLQYWLVLDHIDAIRCSHCRSFYLRQSFGFVPGGQQLYYATILPASTTTNLPYVPNALDLNSQGSLTYVASAAAHAIDIRSTCNQSDQQILAANNPTLVAHIPNGTGAIIADSPAFDLVTNGSIGPGCPPTPASTVNSYNLGGGNFNARQLLFSSDSSHVWLISDLTSVIGFNLSTLAPSTITLANGAQAYSGGITLDGSHIYVGASDNNVHVLDTNTGTDSAQIAVGLKDANGNAVASNLVVVLPK